MLPLIDYVPPNDPAERYQEIYRAVVSLGTLTIWNAYGTLVLREQEDEVMGRLAALLGDAGAAEAVKNAMLFIRPEPRFRS